MYNINIPPLDFSNIDLSNLDLSQFNLPDVPQPTPVAPPPEVLPAPVAPAPQFDPYAGMTPRDLAEAGITMPPNMGVPGIGPMPPSAPSGIETMAPRFQITEDFALPVDQQQLMPATAPATPTPTPTPPPAPVADPAALADAFAGLDYSGLQNLDLSNFSNLTDLPPQRATEPVGPPPAMVSPGQEDYTEGMVTDVPDVSSVAQGLVSNTVTLPGGGTIDLSGLNLGNIDLSSFGVNPNIAAEAGAEAQGTTPSRGNFNPEDYYVPASDFFTDGQLADAGIEPGTTVSAGANPQQPAGTGITLTPEQQAGIDAWIERNPPGSVIGTPFGSISLPNLSQYTGGNTTPTTNVAAAQYVIQNLVPQASETARGGSVATTFGAPVGIPQPPSQDNPFRRPTDAGIASLVPSGG